MALLIWAITKIEEDDSPPPELLLSVKFLMIGTRRKKSEQRRKSMYKFRSQARVLGNIYWSSPILSASLKSFTDCKPLSTFTKNWHWNISDALPGSPAGLHVRGKWYMYPSQKLPQMKHLYPEIPFWRTGFRSTCAADLAKSALICSSQLPKAPSRSFAVRTAPHSITCMSKPSNASKMSKVSRTSRRSRTSKASKTSKSKLSLRLRGRSDSGSSACFFF